MTSEGHDHLHARVRLDRALIDGIVVSVDTTDKDLPYLVFFGCHRPLEPKDYYQCMEWCSKDELTFLEAP